MRKAQFGEGFGRGVWIAPWMGPNGELVMVAVTSTRRQACAPRLVAPGENSVEIADELWRELEAVEPESRMKLRVI